MTESETFNLGGLPDDIFLYFVKRLRVVDAICLALTSHGMYKSILHAKGKATKVNDVVVSRGITIGDDRMKPFHSAMLKQLRPWMPEGYVLCRHKMCMYVEEGKKRNVCLNCLHNFAYQVKEFGDVLRGWESEAKEQKRVEEMKERSDRDLRSHKRRKIG